MKRTLDGFVNKQNWRIWETENPDVALLSYLRTTKVMVCAEVPPYDLLGKLSDAK